MKEKKRAQRNRTITVTDEEKTKLKKHLLKVGGPLSPDDITDRLFNEDLFRVIDLFPEKCADLIVIDPPYNLSKDFNGIRFYRSEDEEYIRYIESWFCSVIRLLKPDGSLYICGEWKSSFALYQVLCRHLIIRNRITWQREKGRGSKRNWKNCTEDIWFATVSDKYYFDAEAVRMKKKVIAPYREKGEPKDWKETDYGNFRLTYPSNFWNDITVPYWSMKENTDHPTQKPEKLLAKIILASCPEEGLVFDPFAGSGTSLVAAKKLNRHYSGIEINEDYCCWALKRLGRASSDKSIQGYSSGVFWERNSLNLQKKDGK